MQDPHLNVTRPRFATREGVATIITTDLFPVSPRTVETWPLRVRIVNKRAILEVSEALAYAEKLVEQAPVQKQGGA